MMWCLLLAVLIDQIQPPNLSPKRRKLTCFAHIYLYYWHSSTCIGDSLFYRHKCKYGEILVRRRNSKSINTTSTPRKTKKAHPTYRSKQNTGVVMAQPTSRTDHVKSVANGAAPYHCLSGPLNTSGYMVPCRGGFGWFPFLPQLKPTILGYK